MGKLFRLLIPRKGSAQTEDLDTNWRAIERWAQNVGGIVEITSKDATVTITDPFGPVTDLSASGGSGDYKSLTGPGKTVTPGALTQAGAFTVNAGTANISFNTTSGIVALDANGGTIGTHVNMSIASNAWGVTGTAAGTPSITVNHNQVGLGVETPFPGLKTIDQLLDASVATPTWTIVANGTHTVIEVDAPGFGRLGFFGAGPSLQQAGAGITTVAQLVTVLQNYGLLS